jgi:hypothetical protein
MSFRNEFIQDRLSIADQKAFIDGDDPFFAEVQRVLTPQNIEAGVKLGFGADRQAIGRVIDALQLDDMIREGGPMHIHQLMVHEGGMHSFIGKAMEPVEKMRLLEALDAMQIERWQAKDGYLGIQEVEMPRRPVTSQILLSQSEFIDDHQVHIDLSKPAVILSATYSMGADILGDGDEPTFKGIGDFIKNHGRKDNIVGAFATHLYQNGYGLDMPYIAYSMAIGPVSQGYNVLGFGAVHSREEYQLAQGHFQRIG